MRLEDRIARLAGGPVASLSRLHGGDLSDVFRADLVGGEPVVAKTSPKVATEARMLRAMAASGAPVPAVIAVAEGLILLEYLAETPARPAAWADLGQSLRALHDVSGDDHGWPEDYAFGDVAILNRPMRDWPAFWASQRLLAAPDALPADLRTRLDRLCARLPDLLPARAAAFLHGDLWSGNLLFSGARAHLIDPACYHGDAEVDLAMLTLFGAPPDAFWAAYGPMPDGAAARRPVYQLWPALVHLRLFGPGYRGLVTRLLDQLGV